MSCSFNERNNDVVLICCENNKIENQNYSLNLIKSGIKFDNKLFQINRTLIEGYFISPTQLYYIFNCKKNGIYLQFFEKSEYDDISNKNDCSYYTGIYQEYFMNLTKKFECNFKNDNFDGRAFKWDINIYHENEYRKIYDCNYRNNKLNGRFEKWEFNGDKTICNYNDNILNGVYQVFNKYDEMIVNKVFINGKPKLIKSFMY
jgi:hypothetical protein